MHVAIFASRLAKEWLPEFDALCQLRAVSAVVYADETSWSINSVWAFLLEHSRITVFGCRKDGETLAVLLKPDRVHYKSFLDALLEIYRQGKAIAADKRLSEAGRRTRVLPQIDAIRACTSARIADEMKPQDDAEKDFFNLTHEIARLMGNNELFTFVIVAIGQPR